MNLFMIFESMVHGRDMYNWSLHAYFYSSRIYTENKAKVKDQTCRIGDVMAMDYDVKSHELNFYKNGEKVCFNWKLVAFDQALMRNFLAFVTICQN